jgi:hypothetical protein
VADGLASTSGLSIPLPPWPPPSPDVCKLFLRKPSSGFAALLGRGSFSVPLKAAGTALARTGVEGRDMGCTFARGGGFPGVTGLAGPAPWGARVGGVVSILARGGGAGFGASLVVSVGRDEEDADAEVGNPLKSGIGVTPNTGFGAA